MDGMNRTPLALLATPTVKVVTPRSPRRPGKWSALRTLQGCDFAPPLQWHRHWSAQRAGHPLDPWIPRILDPSRGRRKDDRILVTDNRQLKTDD